MKNAGVAHVLGKVNVNITMACLARRLHNVCRTIARTVSVAAMLVDKPVLLVLPPKKELATTACVDPLLRRGIPTTNAPTACATGEVNALPRNPDMVKLARRTRNVDRGFASTAFVAITHVRTNVWLVPRRKKAVERTELVGQSNTIRILMTNAGAVDVQAMGNANTTMECLAHRRANVCRTIARMDFAAATSAPNRVMRVRTPKRVMGTTGFVDQLVNGRIPTMNAPMVRAMVRACA